MNRAWNSRLHFGQSTKIIRLSFTAMPISERGPLWSTLLEPPDYTTNRLYSEIEARPEDIFVYARQNAAF